MNLMNWGFFLDYHALALETTLLLSKTTEECRGEKPKWDLQRYAYLSMTEYVVNTFVRL